MPYLVVLLDRWEGFVSAYEDHDNGRLIDAVHRLLAEGPGVGLRFVLSTDRSGLVGRLSTAVEDRVLFRLTDPSDYTLVGVEARELPVDMPPGRAYVTAQSAEAQVALLDADPAGAAQMAAMQRIGRAAGTAYGELPPAQRPARIDPLPAEITPAQASSSTRPGQPAPRRWSEWGATPCRRATSTWWTTGRGCWSPVRPARGAARRWPRCWGRCSRTAAGGGPHTASLPAARPGRDVGGDRAGR